jgi:DNA-binding response OmpR family regulator
LELEDFKVDKSIRWDDWFEKSLLNKYDLILLDVNLPWMDGFNIAEKLSRKIKTPILMITARWAIEDKLKWFKSWVLDYIVKPFDLRELEARINLILKRNIVEDNSFEIWEIYFDFKSRIFKKWEEIIHTTQKEYLILEYLIKRKNEVVSRTDLVEYVWWSSELFDADGKLDVYISNIRKKFFKDIIETVKWVGYKVKNF